MGAEKFISRALPAGFVCKYANDGILQNQNILLLDNFFLGILMLKQVL